jgi:hypothetical protein
MLCKYYLTARRLVNFHVEKFSNPILPSPQSRGPPLITGSQVLIQYIQSYPPYLNTVSSIYNLRHATPPMGIKLEGKLVPVQAMKVCGGVEV